MSYLVHYGSDYCVRHVRDHIRSLKHLQNYEYYGEFMQVFA